MAFLEAVTSEFSFLNSFKASASGWGRPIMLTLLGPFRVCMYPSTFRSISVKNPTLRATHSIIIRAFVMVIIVVSIYNRSFHIFVVIFLISRLIRIGIVIPRRRNVNIRRLLRILNGGAR